MRNVDRDTIRDQRAADASLFLDNPNVGVVHDISRYVRKLDNRLSVPKFIKFEDPNCNSYEKLSPLKVTEHSLSPRQRNKRNSGTYSSLNNGIS